MHLQVRVVTNTWGLPWLTPFATAVAHHGLGNTTNLSLYHLSSEDKGREEAALPVSNLKEVIDEFAHHSLSQASAGRDLDSSSSTSGGGDSSSNGNDDGGEWISATSSGRKKCHHQDGAKRTHDAAVDAFMHLILSSSSSSSSATTGAANENSSSAVPPKPPSQQVVPRLIVVILRGLSGCGKSTLARKLGAAAAAAGYTFASCSADKVKEGAKIKVTVGLHFPVVCLLFSPSILSQTEPFLITVGRWLDLRMPEAI